ncbi:MAG: hypothetical protein AB7U73_16015 [Pirellulales bacterium]
MDFKAVAIVLGVVGGAGLLMCCGCGGIFGLAATAYTAEAADVREELLANPLLKEHVGDIRVLEHKLQRTMFSDEDYYYFRVEGSKASGTITVGDSMDLDLENLDATLRLDSGERIRLTPPFGDDLHDEVEAFLESQPKRQS